MLQAPKVHTQVFSAMAVIMSNYQIFIDGFTQFGLYANI